MIIVFNFSCYSILSLRFLFSFTWRVSLIIYLPLDDLGPPFVDRLGHYLSACPIRYLPTPSVRCSNQGGTVQKSSPHKYSQEVWCDALNVVVASIPSIRLGLALSPKLIFHNRTTSSNVPMTWPSCLRVWPPRNCTGLLGPKYDTWWCYFIKFLFPIDSIMLIVVSSFEKVSKTKAKRKT